MYLFGNKAARSHGVFCSLVWHPILLCEQLFKTPPLKAFLHLCLQHLLLYIYGDRTLENMDGHFDTNQYLCFFYTLHLVNIHISPKPGSQSSLLNIHFLFVCTEAFWKLEKYLKKLTISK